MDQNLKLPTLNPPPVQPHQWLNRVKTFLDVPNPRIVTIFLISSLATITSGIAFFFEWIFHGKNHTGFQWIIYYVLFLFLLLVLIWLALVILMVVSSSHGSKQGSSSTSSSSTSTSTSSSTSTADEEQSLEAKENKCRSLAVVDDDTKKCNDDDTKKCIEKRLFENKTTKLQRAVSYPLHSKVRSCRTR